MVENRLIDYGKIINCSKMKWHGVLVGLGDHKRICGVHMRGHSYFTHGNIFKIEFGGIRNSHVEGEESQGYF